MGQVKFVVKGPPVGKGRPRVRLLNGHGVAYTPKKTANYESLVAMVAGQALDGHPLKQPVDVMVLWIVSVPRSWPKWKRELAMDGGVVPTSKPDLDNVIKSILDGMNQTMLADDSLVYSVSAERRYGEDDYVEVTVTPVHGVLTSQCKTKPS